MFVPQVKMYTLIIEKHNAAVMNIGWFIQTSVAGIIRVVSEWVSGVGWGGVSEQASERGRDDCSDIKNE